jgi:SAM-dependent methyltransferase
LRFITSTYHLSPEEEYKRYLLHQNDSSNTGYVKFLTVAVDCLKTHLGNLHPALTRVLDYGSGPGPVLVQLLNREGFMAIGYDPNFGERSTPDCMVTDSLTGLGLFDAVVSTEVVEHFRAPREEWGKMVSLIRPGGFLVVVTSLVVPGIDLSAWYYANDPTHIAFYSELTLSHIGKQWGLSIVETNGHNRVVMRKHPAA